jgi:hypothetical protein
VFVQSLVEEAKTLLKPVFDDNRAHCKLTDELGSGPADQSWAAYLYSFLPSVRGAPEISFADILKGAGLSPTGCAPLKSLSNVLASATLDNRVLWRLSYKKFNENRAGKLYTLRVLSKMAQSVPQYHDPLSECATRSLALATGSRHSPMHAHWPLAAATLQCSASVPDHSISSLPHTQSL